MGQLKILATQMDPRIEPNLIQTQRSPNFNLNEKIAQPYMTSTNATPSGVVI